MMLTGYADIASIVRAINDGRIYRYIQKPWEPESCASTCSARSRPTRSPPRTLQLAAALADANERLRAENLYLRREVERRYSFDQIIGASPAMNRVFEVMEKVAQTDATVLLTGETGTGKDLVARAIHYAGARRERRFVAQNCGALPDTLLESELFGHKRGAFTGAHADKKGLFELARRRHDLPRRDRRDRAGHAGAPPARAAGRRDPPARLVGDAARSTCASSPRRTATCARRSTDGPLPRGPLLPPARRRDRAAAAARAARGHPGARAPLPRRSRTRRWAARSTGFTNAAMDRLVGARLERQRARARERDPARRRARRRRRRRQPRHALRAPARRRAAPSAAPSRRRRGEARDLNLAVDDLKRRMIQDALRETGSKTKAAESLGIPRQSLQKMMKRLALSDVPT